MKTLKDKLERKLNKQTNFAIISICLHGYDNYRGCQKFFATLSNIIK